MSNVEERVDAPTEDVLEDLLRQAERRPTPSAEQTAAARQAVRAEWQTVSGRFRRRRQVRRYAIAASLLLGVVAIFNLVRTPVYDAVRVAAIEKSFGSIYVLGEQAELRESNDLVGIESGQTILTGADAGLGLAWGKGGSLRLDANTKVEFLGDTAIYLESGRVYFDSRAEAAAPAGNPPRFTVVTDQGEVTHLGTQFMTRVEPDRLIVSVREGRVAVDGLFHDYNARPGEQVVFEGRQRPSVLNISSTGESWAWVSATAPAFDVDGKTLYEFLQWASRELGCELRFEGQAEVIARSAVLGGAFDAMPAEQLRIRLASAALDWRMAEGVIYVSEER
jgi:ferric-dicitrate binding protein FerR (iron transport regulator)